MCLVAQDFNQHESFDFTYYFSLVIKLETIHCVLKLAISQGWSLQQIDVCNTFFNGDIKENLFMKKMTRFKEPKNPDKICILLKVLYGLMKAPQF